VPNLGIGELVVILMLVVLVFGATRLPKIGGDLGKTIRSFKRGFATEDDIKVSGQNKPVLSERSDQSGAGRVKSEVGTTGKR
jgi:sec-independent protein translocase protein TatA